MSFSASSAVKRWDHFMSGHVDWPSWHWASWRGSLLKYHTFILKLESSFQTKTRVLVVTRVKCLCDYKKRIEDTDLHTYIVYVYEEKHILPVIARSIYWRVWILNFDVILLVHIKWSHNLNLRNLNLFLLANALLV